MPSGGAGTDPIFACSGEMAERFATLDWASTSLGPAGSWPAALRTAVAVMLRSRFPMQISWGEDLVMLYNDAYIPTLGAKHPDALGHRLPEEFAEIWEEIGPLQRAVLHGGDATFYEDLPLVIERGDGLEETFFTFSYSHIPDDLEGGPGGVLAVLAITTGTMVGARRLALLNDLATRASKVTDPQQVVAATLEILGEARDDVRHAACWLPGPDGTLALAGSVGEEPVEGAGDVVRLPLRSSGRAAGVLVLAPHPHRPLDHDHRRFLDLVADQASQLLTVANARVDERARVAALAAADEAKSSFLAGVSHEFRTPLTLLLGPLEDALAGRGAQVSRADFEAMHASAHRLLRMVNGLLDIARTDGGAQAAVYESSDVAALTEDLLRPFRAVAARAGLELEADLDEGLGTVETDPRLWEAIVINLVANAVKYTREGVIRVVLAREGDDIVLRVADTGIGIPGEHLGQVFERFHRVGSSDGRSIEGTGLGLTLVDDASRALGGGVTVTSREGEGSVFVVRVPRTLSAPSSIEPTTTAPDPAAAAALALEVGPKAGPAALPDDRSAAATVERPVIVVVDDNVAMRSRLGRLLSGLGTTRLAADGVEALAQMRDGEVDLVVTDVMMPRLDGLGLVQSIRADPQLQHVPVVMVSARVGAEAATEALHAGADDYVVKPFTHDELLARCRTTLELSRLRAASAAARARAAMLAGLSHDLQSPLSVVTTALEMLARPETKEEERVDLSRRGALRARQLDRLVRQFLDWSRLAAGVSITSLLEPADAVALVREVAAQHDGVVVVDAPARLDVVCDPRRTEQILHNLFSNATGAARSRVEVRVVEDLVDGTPSGCTVQVADDGEGVSPRVLPGLFSPFAQSDAERGTGLGLHVSREAARAQGGDLVLSSSDTGGSVFELRLSNGG